MVPCYARFVCTYRGRQTCGEVNEKVACGKTRLGVAPGSAEREKLFWLDDDSRTALSKRIRAVRWRET